MTCQFEARNYKTKSLLFCKNTKIGIMGLKATNNGQDWKGYLINRNSHEFNNKRLTLRSHEAKMLENRLFFDSLILDYKWMD